MIDTVLNFLENALNDHLSARFPGSHAHAVVASPAADDGAAAARIENRLVISLVNIERESAAAARAMAIRSGAGYAQQQPPLYLNLYVLVSASFNNNYKQALRFLSTALGFFQATPTFYPQSSPHLPPELEQLSIELVSMSIPDLNNLWAILGAKYLPSALYKVRMLTVQENWMSAVIPAVDQADVSVGTRP
jgi:hypothetical protein